jgi:xylulokinase|tara:strand:+ start:520 stop:2028 length:1509 start_codon:yes stop_codon:yes gene_type:complete
MAVDQLFLGIDSGTQGTKAIVFSTTLNKVISEGYASHDLIENDVGKKEQEPSWWIEASTKAITKALEGVGSSKDVKAIGVSGQQHGMIPLDAEGHIIRPAKLWCDTETVSQCEEITQKVGGSEKVIDIIGNSIAAGFTASKILWMKQNEPENYQRLATVLLPHDYINYWLTGEKKTEYGDASGTAYFDVKSRTWATSILQAIDDSGKLNDCLPELIESQVPIGTIKPEIAKQFNLSPDVIVSSGGGDNMMGAIGTGNVVPGVVTTSLGTSGTIYSCADQPIIDPKGELAAFCSSSGHWLPLVCTMNVTVSTELTRALLGLGIEDLNKKAASAPVGSEGLTLLPYFNGERTPALPNAKAVIYGITGQNYTSENLCRAAMEGATLGLRYGLDVLCQQGIVPQEIRLVGGGAKSALWRQVVADTFECTVVCPESSEAGAMGAALQAMWCYMNEKEGSTSFEEITQHCVFLDETTRTDPRKNSADQYREIYQHYLELNKIMIPLFN